MKPAAIYSTRRKFLLVFAVIALVLGWFLTEPWRSDIRSHHLRDGSVWGNILGNRNRMAFGENHLVWQYNNTNGSGRLWGYNLLNLGWQFARCGRNELRDVTADDAHRGLFNTESGRFDRTNWLTIHDGEIILVRHATPTQTVYAIQAVEQRNGNGYFRSRQILPAPPDQ